MKNNVKISVVVITHNCKEGLINTIEHILQQTIQSVEIIIVDNMSEDGSEAAVLEKYQDLDDMIYLFSDTLVSRAEAINSGINASTGKYLAFAESGVEWDAAFLEAMLKLLRKNEDLRWVYSCSRQKINGAEVLLPPETWPAYRRSGNVLPQLLMVPGINLNTVVVPFTMIEAVGGLNPALPDLWDYEFLLRLAEKYMAEYCFDMAVTVPRVKQHGGEYITAQCYILSEFADQLSYLGIKKARFEHVKWMAMKFRQEKLFEDCMQLLKEDKDYQSWLKEGEKERSDKKQCLLPKDHVGSVEGCIGCGACEAVCPVKAISMELSEKGFWIPVVRNDLCIHCGKCQLVCVKAGVQKGTPDPMVCYAAQAAEDIRINSSSGGIFPVVAETFLEEDGYVAGAVFDKDFQVKHIVSNQKADIERMYLSKYVQSDMRGVYAQIEVLLQQGRKVLFTGCACQVAGLRRFLKKDYDELILMDVVCHGVPSPGVWNGYLRAMESRNGKIKEVYFRRKEKLGWGTGLYIKFENGEEYLADNNDVYIKSFLSNWTLNDNCYCCEFKNQKYSDITAGDFWGISTLDSSFQDKTGTSFITLNTAKGKDIMHDAEKSLCRFERFLSSDAVKGNPSIYNPVERTEISDCIWIEKPTSDLAAAVNKVFSKIHFDVALVLLWSENYGNALTNYALYRTIAKKRKVISIDNMMGIPQGRFAVFAHKHQLCSSRYFAGCDLQMLDHCCDVFVVGSDQTWNKESTHNSFFQLGFVQPPGKKVSYAASFGQRGQEPSADEYAQFYRDFDYISVREPSGVVGCREEYGVEAEQVLDPVFLLKDTDYKQLTKELGVLEDGPFVLAYFLNPTPLKRKLSKLLAAMLGDVKIISITEEHPGLIDDNRFMLEYDNVKTGLMPEQWLYYFENCEYVLTDSFHGTCFAMIYQKQFLTFVNRQRERFEVFRQFAEISGRIVDPDIGVDYNMLLNESIDYDRVNEDLEQERKRSLKWLWNALTL